MLEATPAADVPPVPPPETSPEAPAGPPPGPSDLPSAAPAIGRVGPVTAGRLAPATSLRPPAVALDGTTAGDFHVAAASIIGTGHLQSGQPRQDGYNVMVGNSGRLYVAIADGLGSKPASQLGAHLFSESVLIAAAHAEAGGDDEPPTASRLLAQADARMAQVVTDHYQLEAKSCSCVGAVAVFSADGCDIARLGDVSAFTLADGAFDEAFPADSALVNVVSASMPGADEADVETTRIGPEPVVVFGTDGLANDLRNSGALREWLAAQWRVPQLPFAIGDALRYRRQGSHDDRTAVVVWRTALPAVAFRPEAGRTDTGTEAGRTQKGKTETGRTETGKTGAGQAQSWEVPDAPG